jgi:hypothetical protein
MGCWGADVRPVSNRVQRPELLSIMTLEFLVPRLLNLWWDCPLTAIGFSSPMKQITPFLVVSKPLVACWPLEASMIGFSVEPVLRY